MIYKKIHRYTRKRYINMKARCINILGYVHIYTPHFASFSSTRQLKISTSNSAPQPQIYYKLHTNMHPL